MDQGRILAVWSEELPFPSGSAPLWVTLAAVAEGLCWLSLGDPGRETGALLAWTKRWLPESKLVTERKAHLQTLAQLAGYFEGRRQTFDVPLHLVGTPFQLKVWGELQRIPYGQTASYGEIAAKVGRPQGQRAVGMANNRNPVSIIVPCHRVIGKQGDLVGYGGGLELKRQLLALEKANGIRGVRA